MISILKKVFFTDTNLQQLRTVFSLLLQPLAGVGHGWLGSNRAQYLELGEPWRPSLTLKFSFSIQLDNNIHPYKIKLRGKKVDIISLKNWSVASFLILPSSAQAPASQSPAGG